MPSENPWDAWKHIHTNAIDEDTLRRALYARMQAAMQQGEKLVEDYRMKIAENFLLAGITLIPSDHLLDHQYVVSRGVYEAALKLCKNVEKKGV